MWSALTKAFSPAAKHIDIIVNPLTTPPHFPPFERKGTDGQFEIVHAPTRHTSLQSLSLPSGLLVTESTTSTPRNDLLHDILISIPAAHWTKLVDHNNQHCALQVVLHFDSLPTSKTFTKLFPSYTTSLLTPQTVHVFILYLGCTSKQRKLRETRCPRTNYVPLISLGSENVKTFPSHNQV